MKVPVAPSVGLQPDRRPDFTSNQVVPQSNLNAEVAGKFGEGLEAAGQAVLRVQDVLGERLARSRAREADAKIADGYRRLMTSPEGYRNAKGRNAVDGRKDILKAVDEHRKGILDTLSPVERELVADSDGTRYQQVREAIDGHYARELDAYDLSTSEARADALMKDAVEGYFAPVSPLNMTADDPQEPGAPSRPGSDPFTTNRTAMRTELMEQAQKRGFSKEMTESLLAKADDNLHSGVVSALIYKGRAIEAKGYLREHDKEITTKTKDRLSEGLDLAVTQETAGYVAKGLSTMEGGITAQFAQLQSLYDQDQLGENKDAVFRAALGQLTQKDRLVSEETKRQQTAAWDRIEPFAQLHGGQLDTEMLQLVKDNGLEDKFRLFIMRGQQWITTDVGHYALTAMDGRELRQKFSSEAALRFNYRWELTTPDLDSLTQRWREAGTQGIPKLDKSIVFADGLREALQLPKTAKLLDKDLFDRWSNAVTGEVQRLMREKPGTKEEEHWGAAIEAAKDQGFFLNAEGTQSRMFIQAEPKEWGSSAFVRTPDGKITEAALDLIHPASGETYRATIQETWRQQRSESRPDKPKGYVMVGGKAVPWSTVKDDDLVREAAVLRSADTRQKTVETRRVGQQWLKDAFAEEFRKVAGTRSLPSVAGPGYEAESSVQTLPVAPDKLDAVKAKAREGIMRRSSEWQGFHLTQPEIDAIIGPAPPEPQRSPSYGELRRAGL